MLPSAPIKTRVMLVMTSSAHRGARVQYFVIFPGFFLNINCLLNAAAWRACWWKLEFSWLQLVNAPSEELYLPSEDLAILKPVEILITLHYFQHLGWAINYSSYRQFFFRKARAHGS